MNLPDLPNWHALGVMLLTVVTLFLFARERVPIETTSIFVLALLAVSFTIFPFEADGGASSPRNSSWASATKRWSPSRRS